MKILLVTMEWPPFKGGVGNYYYNLVKNLTVHEVKVFNVDQSSFYRFFWPKWLKLFFQIKKMIKLEKPDLIWVGAVLPVGEAVYLIKKFFKIPYFVSAHGMDIMLPQKQLRKEKALKQVLDNAEFITANSNFTKKELLNLGYAEDKVEVVYPCPHINFSKNQTAVKPELINKKVLLTVGRLVERKGQGRVIEIMLKLLKRFPNLVYLIIGQGPAETDLKLKIKNLGLSQQVFILDKVTDDELPGYYQAADLFVMPATDFNGDLEGFGIVYLEAALFGLPVVAGQGGGVMEAVINNQTGLLVNPTNPNDLIEKINRLLTDKLLYQKLADNAKVRVERDFIWGRQVDKLIFKLNLWRKTKK